MEGVDITTGRMVVITADGFDCSGMILCTVGLTSKWKTGLWTSPDSSSSSSWPSSILAEVSVIKEKHR